MTSNENWSERTENQPPPPTTTTGLGTNSPSRITFGDDFIAENSDIFREIIRARNVFAAWARMLTNARPNDPDLQNYHVEVGKSGEIVSNLLTKLNVLLIKISATEKELDLIVFRARNKVVDPHLPRLKRRKRRQRVAPHVILYQMLSECLGKELRLISGFGILFLCTPPPAVAGVMWRVRLGSHVGGRLGCR
ncbi:hypothetical protein TNIN_352401 [Trichonephila inaurata madagascariensis]|uniref:Uncharacterized protein n=1 Tax=Trichonephila inaurata madagascariensis TaxID=2747483 RepID=A0A8X6X540_9ARAC|nr:hypothetical protein TNIN_352401 [Trichonephila inaurata madagascariensis]